MSSPFFSILLNSSPTRLFLPLRGIRQGDPLSLFLFILAAEGLRRLIKSQARQGWIRGLSFFEGMEKQTGHQFVDDTMLMGHPSVQGPRAFKSYLVSFNKASGVEMNLEKSLLFFFSSPLITQKKIGGILGFQKGRLPTKYLGVPLSHKLIRRASWKDLVHRVKARLSRWEIKPLNLPERLVMVQSVIQAMPMYLLSVL